MVIWVISFSYATLNYFEESRIERGDTFRVDMFSA